MESYSNVQWTAPDDNVRQSPQLIVLPAPDSSTPHKFGPNFFVFTPTLAPTLFPNFVAIPSDSLKASTSDPQALTLMSTFHGYSFPRDLESHVSYLYSKKSYSDVTGVLQDVMKTQMGSGGKKSCTNITLRDEPGNVVEVSL
ncbi:hypothetical protein KIW84_071998 [Lathyrus oleraceus]|uniref:Uncharacterized protein n=1 Tax=Pisum sativum TaxID=3888 RepID=A0A9D4VKY0_PEA|nr:hypothetical protein KIW84_071998 [Pisum sativum]